MTAVPPQFTADKRRPRSVRAKCGYLSPVTGAFRRSLLTFGARLSGSNSGQSWIAPLTDRQLSEIP